MVGTLKIAGGLRSKNYGWQPAAVCLSALPDPLHQGCIGRASHVGRTSAKEGRKKEKNNIDLQQLLRYCVREHIKSAERIKRGCKKWVFATRLGNSELSPRV